MTPMESFNAMESMQYIYTDNIKTIMYATLIFIYSDGINLEIL